MRDEILLNINDAQQLERLYRSNKPAFKADFDSVYPELKGLPLAEGWYQRLNYHQESSFWGTAQERMFVFVSAMVAIFLAKFPAMFNIDPEFYFMRNVSFIVLPVLMAYFAWKNRISNGVVAVVGVIILLCGIYINSLPGKETDTLILACIHLPLLLWIILGFVFGGASLKKGLAWPAYLKFNGEFAVMTALLVIACGFTTAITMGLFTLVGLDIKTWYFEYIVISGLATLPIVSTFLVQNQPSLVNRIAPLIANLFSPLALVMLVGYLTALVVSGKSLFFDREVLMVFNMLLLAVMALIFFSVSDVNRNTKSSFQLLILFALAVVTIIVNGIALSAVLYRITEWGITPNRLAVLGANILMLIHLLYTSFKLFKVVQRKGALDEVSKSMSLFIPVYGIWCIIVVFLFPFVFGFK